MEGPETLDSTSEPLKELDKLQVEIELLVQKQANAREELEKEHLDKCQPLYERRRKIVMGEVEPTKEEVEGISDGEEEDESSGITGESGEITAHKKQAKGVPYFWLSVLKNQETTSNFVRKRDEGALEYLEDIRCRKSKGREGFRFEFQFAANPYFHEKLLVKEVYTHSLTAPTSMMELRDIPPIRWKSTEMNLCVRQITKAAKKHKGRSKGAGLGSGGAPAVKVKPCTSFFNLFAPNTRFLQHEKKLADLDLSDEDEDLAVAAMEGLELDEGIAQVSEEQLDLMTAIWNEVVPNAVVLYTSGSYGSGGKESDDTDPYEVVSASEPGLETLPSAVRRRVRALKKLHKKLQDLQEDKMRAIVVFREDFAVKGTPIYAKRRSIVLGKKGLAVVKGDEDLSGKKPSWFLAVPRFWLLALKGCSTIVDLIRRRDEPVLSYLIDVRFKRIMEGFTLDFEFLPNPFFSDQVLSKTFLLHQDGELVTSSEESVVHWKAGKNITVRQTTDDKSGRLNAKACPSFFHLFSTPHPHLLYAAALGSEFRQHETSTATSLRDIVILRALEMYHIAAEWDNGDESERDAYGETAETSSASDSEGDADDGQEGEDGGEDAADDAFVADENKLKKLAGKKRRKKEEGGIVCCGLTKGQMLIGMTLLLLSAEAIMLAEMLFR